MNDQELNIKNYDEIKMEKELELIEVQINESEIKEKLFSTLNILLNIIGLFIIGGGIIFLLTLFGILS